MGRPSKIDTLVNDMRVHQEKEAEFKARISAASGDVLALADLLAEAARHERSTRKDSPVGRDGKATFTVSQLFACYILDAAENAYSAARARATSPSAPPAPPEATDG